MATEPGTQAGQATLREERTLLADARERRYVAAAGAVLYALSCAGYALATTIPVAYAAAAVGGIGGALLWVTVGAIVGERLPEDSAVYPRLLSAVETGAWIAFVAGLSLLGVIDFRGVFLACAVACAAAAVVCSRVPRELRAWPPARAGPRRRASGSGRWAAGSGRRCSRSR